MRAFTAAQYGKIDLDYLDRNAWMVREMVARQYCKNEHSPTEREVKEGWRVARTVGWKIVPVNVIEVGK